MQKEKVSDVKKKHIQLYQYARNLYEAVEFFGKVMRPDVSVFHGLNVVLCFEKFTKQFNQPLSTTTVFKTARQFANGVGIILELRSGVAKTDDRTTMPKYLEVSTLSDFPGEHEWLFYGRSTVLQIYNIIEASVTFQKGTHAGELCMFNKFQQLIQSQEIRWTMAELSALIELIQYQKMVNKNVIDVMESKDNDSNAKYSKYHSKYGKQLFNHFCRHKNTKSVAIHNFESLPQIMRQSLFHCENQVPSIIPILELFPYLREISFNSLQLIHMEQYCKDYVEAVLQYIDHIEKEKNHMHTRYLKKLSFQSEPQKITENNKTIKQLETLKFEILQNYQWGIKYELAQNVHNLIFINADTEKEQHVLKQQLAQQYSEKKEAELKQQLLKQKQLQQMEKAKIKISENQLHEFEEQKYSNLDSKIVRMCNQLRSYYKMFNKSYDNLFREYCDENGLEDDTLQEELQQSPLDCLLVDFDDDFPFKKPPINYEEKLDMIHAILV
eukprot:446220_1